MIDPDSPTPFYRQLADILRAQIQSGELTGMVPSERTLRERYGLAQGTVRKALDVLVAEDLIVRVRGRGTFVKRS